ncbi:hypothetical protein Xkoz_00828 [Xenorhabdus kozodoii]|uniref:Uncharacterized protein n=1 Tax=Xenorhabdus kozodoii TaxID=351676 RepID=A0A2D0LF11_9GAMM|nr:hypothetical protein Xkoz_00828 [Xenorhabdus kozodoii]
MTNLSNNEKLLVIFPVTPRLNSFFLLDEFSCLLFCVVWIILADWLAALI